MDAILLARDSETTRQAYAIARSIEPSVLSLPWVISIVNSVCGRSKVAPMKPANETSEHEGPTRRDSLFTEALMVDVQNQSNEDAGMNKKVMDDAMRNEIVEYLLKGIRRSIVSCSSAKKGLDDAEERAGCAKRFLKTICGCCVGGSDERVRTSSIAEDPSIFKRVSLIERKCIVKEARREQVFRIPLDNRRMGNEFIFDDDSSSGGKDSGSKDIKFVSLGPKVFQNLRSLHNVNENDIMSLFSVTNLVKNKLKVVLQSGKGGSFFVIPENGKYLIKSINEGEYRVMKTILADLYVHYLAYPASYIDPIYGCYALFLSEANEIEPQYFVLMKNVLDINKEQLPEGSEVLSFDLKGSTAGRKSLPDPSVLLGGGISEEIQKMTLKDEDLYLSFKSLELAPAQGDSILRQLEADTQFFSKFLLIDYSLLLFIINVPYKSFISSRRDRGGGYKRANELVVTERTMGSGKTELLLEERGRSTNSVFRVASQMDVNAMRNIEEKCRTADERHRGFFKSATQGSGLDEEGKVTPKQRTSKESSRGGSPESPRRLIHEEPASNKDECKAKEEALRHVFNFPTVLNTDDAVAPTKCPPINESIGKDLKDTASYIDEGYKPQEMAGLADPSSNENQLVRKRAARDPETPGFRGDEELGIARKRNYGENVEPVPEAVFDPGAKTVY